MNNFAIDLNLEIDYILKNENFFSTLNFTKVNKPNHVQVNVNECKDQFLDWVTDLGLFIKHLEIFYTNPYGNIFIHVDDIDPIDSCKINYVYDCGNTTMNWYRIKNNASLKVKNNNIGSTYLSCDNETDYILAYKHVIKKGTLVNVAIPHGVQNNSKYPRYCISVTFQCKNNPKRIGFNEMLQLVNPWIIPNEGNFLSHL